MGLLQSKCSSIRRFYSRLQWLDYSVIVMLPCPIEPTVCPVRTTPMWPTLYYTILSYLAYPTPLLYLRGVLSLLISLLLKPPLSSLLSLFPSSISHSYLYFFNHLTSSPAPSPGRFFKDCSIVYVIVDDKIPVKAKDGRPIFGHAKDPNELWVCILEKGDSMRGKHGAINHLIYTLYQMLILHCSSNLIESSDFFQFILFPFYDLD